MLYNLSKINEQIMSEELDDFHKRKEIEECRIRLLVDPFSLDDIDIAFNDIEIGEPKLKEKPKLVVTDIRQAKKRKPNKNSLF